MSRGTLDHMLRRSVRPCHAYNTFGTCQFGSECLNDHGGASYKSEFCVWKIIGRIPSCGGRLALRGFCKLGKIREEVFHIPSGDWFLAGALEGDLVILQISEEKKNSLNCVRVVLVLCKSCEVEKPFVVESVESAFTLDAAGTRIRDDAISVGPCSDHSHCKKIGIHVVILGVRSRISTGSIEPYGSRWLPAAKYGGMEKGNLTPAMSVFFHTQSDEVSSPMISVVKVEKNYEFRNFANVESIEEIWQRFVGAKLQDMLSSTYLSCYVVNYPFSWRGFVLLDNISKEYSTAVTKSIRSANSSKNNFVTTEPQMECNHLKPLKVTAFKDECDRATADNDELVLFMSRIFKFLRPQKDEKNYFPQRYQCDVELLVRKNSIVKCTSPLVEFKNFLNQQILLHSLVKPHGSALYSRDDLLGLLVPRFKTPNLTKVICRGFNKDGLSATLEYIGEDFIDSTIARVSISVFDGKEGASVHGERAKFLYTGLSCFDEDFCNRNLVHFDYDVYEDLVKKWRNHENVKEILQKLHLEKSVESPYQCKVEKGERIGTILTLKAGVELQMQISKHDAKDRGISLGLRMLRIGRDCHLCFTHINYPEKALLSDRNDVRQLVSNDYIIALQRATTDEILASSKQITAEVTWFGDYMGSGSFLVDDAEYVNARDLLCIRREIFNGDAVKYIWCCHGVVESVDGSRVLFATCTLSQTQNPPRQGNFCVTVIRPNTIESKVAARQRSTIKRRNTL